MISVIEWFQGNVLAGGSFFFGTGLPTSIYVSPLNWYVKDLNLLQISLYVVLRKYFFKFPSPLEVEQVGVDQASDF